MLPADWEEYLQKAEREVKRPAGPPRRRQPRIARMQSGRMQTVSRQTPNLTRAMYVPESEYAVTPTKPEEWRGTHEVGPGDKYNPERTWRTGKTTIEPRVTGSKVTPRKKGSARKGRNTKVDYDALAKQFEI